MHKSMTTQLKEHKAILGVTAASIICICLSLHSGVFGVVAFMVNIVAIFTFSPEEYTISLISLIPWAYVFKINGISTSMFAILVVAMVVRYVVMNRFVDRAFFTYLLIFVVSTVIQLKMKTATMIVMYIKLVINIVLLYEMCKHHNGKNVTVIMYCFAISVIIASSFAYFLPNKAILYSRIKELGILVEFKYERFTGLQNDPNYYNASLIISMLSLCYLYIKRNIGIFFYPMSAVCVFYGFMTYSKSFFLLFAAWLVVIVYYALKNKRYFVAAMLLIGSILIALYLLTGNVQTVNVLLNRFGDASGATSGRTDIWGLFYEYFESKPMALLFGNGFGSLILDGHASHNTYIDTLYYFGVFGTIFLIAIIRRCFKQYRTVTHERFAYIFTVFLLAIYFFLSGITLCEFPFYLYFVFMFFNIGEYTKNDKKEALRL